MKNLYEAATTEEVKQRIASLKPSSERQWGTMTVAQTVAHCSVGLECAVGDISPPRVFIGRIMGWMVKPLALGNDKPMRRNSPTAKVFVIQGDRNLEAEQTRLTGLIDRFTTAGPAGCTTHPHSFFGPLIPEEWAELMYKHLDHHLRQFNA